MKAVHLTVPRVPKSPNQLRGHHWTVKHKDRQDWDVQVMTALSVEHRSAKIKIPIRRKVTLEIFSPYREMDPDNLHGSVKPILDSLVTNFLLFDDKREWCLYKVSQHKSTKKQMRTEITIESL